MCRPTSYCIPFPPQRLSMIIKLYKIQVIKTITMKLLKYNVLLLSFLYSIAVQAQQKTGFGVNGHIDGLKDGIVVKLGNRFKDWHNFTEMDSCIVKDGNFNLKSAAYVPEGPRFYQEFFFNG